MDQMRFEKAIGAKVRMWICRHVPKAIIVVMFQELSVLRDTVNFFKAIYSSVYTLK
jgi:hypothetical protein